MPLDRSKSRVYVDAKIFLFNKGVKTQREYSRWIKGKSLEYRMPCGPRKFYGLEWKGWGDFLGTNVVALISKEFYSYGECSDLVISKGIKSKREYQKIRKTISDPKIPSNPDKSYEEWSSWESFFKTEKPNFLPFKEAIKYVHKLGIGSHKEWILWHHKNNIKFLPTYPNDVYDEWISWMDWLNTDNIPKRISMGSKCVENFLINNNIKYVSEKTFPGCKNINLLYFDFYIESINTCIEFDGVQHYKSNDRFGGIKGLDNQKIRDSIKNKYCKDNNIRLIRIPYWELSNIDLILKNNLEHAII